MTEMKKRKKRLNGMNILDTYEMYKENVSKERRFSKMEYYKVVKKFLMYMSDKLIDIGILKLPKNLGVLQIMGDDIKIRIDKKTGKMKGAIDWNSTKKLWEECEECKRNRQLVFFTNDSEGFKIYKVMWFNKTNNLINKRLYRFKASTSLKKKLTKRIKSGDFAYLYRQKKQKKCDK